MSQSLWLAIVCLAVVPDDSTGRWTGFRNGGASQTECHAVPLRWSPGENIAWERELPGYGQSAPVVWGGTVFITAVDGPRKEHGLLMALDAERGAPQWQVRIRTSSGLPSNYAVARAAPTPAVDARGVYAFFEGGDVVAVSHAGQILWQRSLVKDYGALDNHHALGASPAQTDDGLVLNIEHRGPSYLLCLDKQTGATRWKVPRRSSMSWSSPLVITRGGRQFVVVSTGGAAEIYDARSGASVWSLPDVSGNAIPSPSTDGEFLFLSAALSDFDSAAKAARSNVCLRMAADGTCEVLWRAERALCDYASPVVCGECVYYINRVGVLYCLDRPTGREHYTHRLPGPCWATPIAAGDRLYIFGKNGTATVVQSGPQWRELARNLLWDPDHPPRPQSYVEAARDSDAAHGSHGHASSPASTTPQQGSAPDGKRRESGFAALLLQHDRDGDGHLTSEELPPDQRRLLAAGDKDQNARLDGAELHALGEAFRQRRAGAAEESRDPLVYGVAAAGDAFFVRTGTRLYCLRERTPQ